MVKSLLPQGGNNTRKLSHAGAARIGKEKLYPFGLLLILLLLWQGVCSISLVPAFLLPSPLNVAKALWLAFPELLSHSGVTLLESLVGLFFGLLTAFLLAVLMDSSPLLYQGIYPILVVSQTVPTVALAPLLVLWLGYGILPKIVLVALVCFFPLAVSLLSGFRSIDPDTLGLFKAMGANSRQIFRHLKLPGAMPGFFAGLRVSVTYAIVGGVIAEWLGGQAGLGVYMTRVRKAYAYDKMFAVIVLIILWSLTLIKIVDLLERRVNRWQYASEEKLN
ncbi:MAG: ABC transporter permease [Clostridiales bacterium]|jgi:ABC-type nitrate/sulfonate/bicarbonate transport system permease component|nr:ABC transporter permease [Clostridiales bacterium]